MLRTSNITLNHLRRKLEKFPGFVKYVYLLKKEDGLTVHTTTPIIPTSHRYVQNKFWSVKVAYKKW